MPTPSIAPSAARMPHRICAASNAGPAGAAVATTRSLEPSAISLLVPTSMKRRSRRSRVRPVASMPGDDVAADVGAQRGQHERPVRGDGRGRRSPPLPPAAAARAATTNGAIDSGSGSMPSAIWVIVTLPQTTIS